MVDYHMPALDHQAQPRAAKSVTPLLVYNVVNILIVAGCIVFPMAVYEQGDSAFIAFLGAIVSFIILGISAIPYAVFTIIYLCSAFDKRLPPQPPSQRGKVIALWILIAVNLSIYAAASFLSFGIL